MQLLQDIDTKLAQTVPYYSEVATFTAENCKASYDKINQLYQCSTNKVKKMTKSSKQFKKDMVWIISQTTEDFLGFIEEKLEIECPEADEKDKTKRAINIFNELKSQKLMIYVDQFVNFNKDLLKKGKIYGERHFLPIYVTLKATLLVSKQTLMDIFVESLGQLKMTYKCHKDTITVFCSGEFKEEKILQNIKKNFGWLKQLTVNFVQKGLEISISKKELIENYHHIMKTLNELVKGVSEKSIEQWASAKTKTVNLYNSVLEKIKAKQIQIRIQMIKDQSLDTSSSEKSQAKQTQAAPAEN